MSYVVACERSDCDLQIKPCKTIEDALIACQDFAKENGSMLSEWNKWVNDHQINNEFAIREYSHKLHSKKISVFKIS
jgi:hypothetical protein